MPPWAGAIRRRRRGPSHSHRNHHLVNHHHHHHNNHHNNNNDLNFLVGIRRNDWVGILATKIEHHIVRFKQE
jgi:hypothetical protein